MVLEQSFKSNAYAVFVRKMIDDVYRSKLTFVYSHSMQWILEKIITGQYFCTSFVYYCATLIRMRYTKVSSFLMCWQQAMQPLLCTWNIIGKIWRNQVNDIYVFGYNVCVHNLLFESVFNKMKFMA
jgi:hypothetical protein